MAWLLGVAKAAVEIAEVAATASNSIPLSNGGNNDSVVTRPDAPRHGYINDMEIDEQGLDTLGVNGRKQSRSKYGAKKS